MAKLLQLKQLHQLKADREARAHAVANAKFILDPNAWIQDRLGEFIWSKQRAIAESVRDNRRTAVQSCHDAGKCIYHTEMLTLFDGRVVQAKDLIGRYFVVPAFLPDGTQRPALAWGTDNGVKPVFRVTTDAGREIVRTGNHPLFKGTRSAAASGRNPKVKSVGWTTVEDLAVEDLVLVPEQLHVQGARPASEDHVKLLGYLLGDGGTTTNVTFTQKDGPAKAEFVEIVERLGARTAVAGTYGLRTVGAEGGRFADGNNPIINLAREWGLFGCKAVNKSFPAWAWELPNDQLALLLNRLFSCDGWAYVRPDQAKGHGSIGMSLASERLLRDVELALLRLGIPGRVRQRAMKLDGKVFPAWEWTTTQATIIQRFANVIGIFGKEPALDRCVEWSKTVDLNRVSKWRNVEAPEGYRWEKVKSVEAIGEEPTVSISVEEHHTFVTTFVEHNSFISSRIAAWWIDTHPPGEALVVSTAPTYQQVHAILWEEIRKAAGKAANRGSPLPGRILQSDVWKFEDGTLAGFGRKPADTDIHGFQGHHRRYVLVILDEACGIPQQLWTAVEAITTNADCRILAIGNPDDPAAEFGAVCKPGSGWNVIRISAFDTPNFTDEPVPDALRPLLLDPEWELDKRKRWGAESPRYVSKVLGEFPDIGEDVLISPSLIRAAQERQREPGPYAILGVDVARFGSDRTVFCLRQGPLARIVGDFAKQSTTETTGKVIEAIREHSLDEVRVDGVGVGGGVVDQLVEHGVEVIDMQAGGAALDSEMFINARAEWAWGIRTRMEEGDLDLDPADEDLAAQLGALRYKFTSRGQVQIESKDDMRKRGLPSPDRADALMLTAAAAPTVERVVEDPEHDDYAIGASY